jgi:phospholipid/cholesterol/gamma-HCH transport system substrate-binding protein
MSNEEKGLSMALKSTEIRVGLVVVIAAAILLSSLLWIKGFRINRHRYEVPIIFSTVGGLTAGDPVQVAGVEKGKVQDIQLRASDVQVTISLESDVRLSEDAEISIQNVGLMGEKFVAIDPGNSPQPLPTDQPIFGQYKAGMAEVMGETEELLRQISGVAATIQETIGNPEARVSIQESLENIRKFSSVLADLLDQEGGDLTMALKDLRTASRGFRELVEDNQSQMDSTMDRFHQASIDLEQLTQQLTEISATFKRMADKIERGEGSLGEFVHDETLYSDIKNTVKSLDELILDIKENPDRYIHLELF